VANADRIANSISEHSWNVHATDLQEHGIQDESQLKVAIKQTVLRGIKGERADDSSSHYYNPKTGLLVRDTPNGKGYSGSAYFPKRTDFLQHFYHVYVR
jgi:hypothetical protein